MRRSALAVLLIGLLQVPLAGREWEPKQAPLMTRWAKDVAPEKVLPEYPRPQMVREQWQNLNGLWDYAIVPKDAAQPGEYQGKILVPFAAESALSGVMKPVGAENHLWYRRSFTVPGDWAGKIVLLHFGAVDWRATVWVNGKEVGKHEGGYDPFSFDVTEVLREGENEIVVSVWDPSDEGVQPRGKQVKNPHGIWYTPVTGIWRTVWLEPVSESHIQSLEIEPDFDANLVRVSVQSSGEGLVRLSVDEATCVNGTNSHASARAARAAVAVGKIGQPIELKLPLLQRWTPEEPWLIGLNVELLNESGVLDSVESYFGMRKIELKKAADGFNRLFLNNKPVFQFGPLDQGWWPDGLYTAPTDEALVFDIEMTKKLGFNMARKHVKVEPARWYYHCDRLGLLVWQDMPNGDAHFGRGVKEDITRTPDSEAIYRTEWKAIIESLKNHPSIVVWVPFNEGWGQFKTNEILAWTKELDPSRLVDGPSGWEDRGEGDMIDAHIYPGPGMFPAEDKRATVLGEFGGLGWPVKEHLWQAQDNWGYRTYQSQEELVKNYRDLIVQLPPLIGSGLAAAIYTQTTDVEIEVNGLMTYDREVVKFPLEETAKLNQLAYKPGVKLREVVPTSATEPRTWKYTTDKPAENWAAADFDDAAWKAGPGGFGTKETPNTNVGTAWNTPEIWLRRTVELPDSLKAPALRVFHDEDVEVFLNGERVGGRQGHTGDYVLIPLDEEARKAVRGGKNVLAVHCRQTKGGQFIDVGIVDFVPVE